VNIEHGASFGSGLNIVIGNNSGIGINANIPGNTVIGNNVMMGPNCYIAYNNHNYSRLDVPMCKQGGAECQQTIIGNDVWIARDVRMTAGRKIADGSIIALGCVLTKDFPPYSIVGGNPGKLIKLRR
jgi:galactoside O-acetyltransferase